MGLVVKRGKKVLRTFCHIPASFCIAILICFWFNAAFAGHNYEPDVLESLKQIISAKESLNVRHVCNGLKTEPPSYCSDISAAVCNNKSKLQGDQIISLYQSRCLPDPKAALQAGPKKEYYDYLEGIETTMFSDKEHFRKKIHEHYVSNLKRVVLNESDLPLDVRKKLAKDLQATELKFPSEWTKIDPVKLIDFVRACGADGMKVNAFHSTSGPPVIVICPGALVLVSNNSAVFGSSVLTPSDASSVRHDKVISSDSQFKRPECELEIDWMKLSPTINHELGHGIHGINVVFDTHENGMVFQHLEVDKNFHVFFRQMLKGYDFDLNIQIDSVKTVLMERMAEQWSRKRLIEDLQTTKKKGAPITNQDRFDLLENALSLYCYLPNPSQFVAGFIDQDPELLRLIGCRQ